MKTTETPRHYLDRTDFRPRLAGSTRDDVARRMALIEAPLVRVLARTDKGVWL